MSFFPNNFSRFNFLKNSKLRSSIFIMESISKKGSKIIRLLLLKDIFLFLK